MALTVVTSPRFQDHVTPPGHPERVERAEVMEVAALDWERSGGRVMAPRAATDEDLGRVHTPAYLESLRAVRGRAVMLDPDTFTSPESEEVARLAAGGVLTAVDAALDGSPGSRVLVMARPPGHHAEADRAMGFCLYNSVAVGAAWARVRGAARVAIVDIDVHHGNGTQRAFYDDPSVLFVSSHQFPYYPGTGGGDEVGRGDGAGFTVNLPLEAGATDADYDLVYRELVTPLVGQFRPDLLLVSAGFDAHERDPLAGMRVTTAGFRQLTARLLAIADAACDGRVVFVTEGGYDTSSLAECLEGVIALASGRQRPTPAAALAGDTRRGAAALSAARQALGRFWPGL
ncbi:MAG: histone deacetylase [Acidobacteriota bacterium]